MPVVLREAGFSFIIYTDDHAPAHAHVKKAGNEAKIEIDSLRVIWYWGFNSKEIRRAKESMDQNRDLLMTRWNELHGGEK